jgi:hypothetical protein
MRIVSCETNRRLQINSRKPFGFARYRTTNQTNAAHRGTSKIDQSRAEVVAAELLPPEVFERRRAQLRVARRVLDRSMAEQCRHRRRRPFRPHLTNSI